MGMIIDEVQLVDLIVTKINHKDQSRIKFYFI